jgi:hypothetical protein
MRKSRPVTVYNSFITIVINELDVKIVTPA